MTTTEKNGASRGQLWLELLSGQPGQDSQQSRAVRYADAALGAEQVRFISVVPDPANRFPRARRGEVGLEQGWALAQLVRATIAADADRAHKRPIIAVVDVIGQAYGRREELMGIHIACAAAADAYASARLAGHPVVALIVGHAMSGAFLAHGYQANRIIALDAPGVLIHAMGQAAAARITRRTVAQLAELGERIPPMSYDVRNYAKLGLLHELVAGVDPEAPDLAAQSRVLQTLGEAVTAIRADGRRDLGARYDSAAAQQTRAASITVRRALAQQW
jgi:malonate decarboxylase gamma subunit